VRSGSSKASASKQQNAEAKERPGHGGQL